MRINNNNNAYDRGWMDGRDSLETHLEKAYTWRGVWKIIWTLITRKDTMGMW